MGNTFLSISGRSIGGWVGLVLCLLAGVVQAQSGSFVIPGIRANSGTDFGYWDLFRNQPGYTNNYNYDNPPALLDGQGRDDDNNHTTIGSGRASVRQTATTSCFVTSSGALYSYMAPTAFVVPYTQPIGTTTEITNVIFQAQTGGIRMNLDGVKLHCIRELPGGGTAAVQLSPAYRGLDDPQTGGFSERLVSAFQWDLTGLGVRSFEIVFASDEASMPLWQAQLDVVSGAPFVQELGYLLFTRSRPLVRYGRAGAINKNLPMGVDGRFFFAGETLDLLADPDLDWEHVGFVYEGNVIEGYDMPLIFPAQDTTVTALFAPLTYAAWRDKIFYHSNSLTGSPNDNINNAVSAPEVDFDGDGMTNQMEYALGGDPYTPDSQRMQPVITTVTVGNVVYPAVRYRTNGAPTDYGDVGPKVMVSTDLVTWSDNETTPGVTVTEEFSSELQNDGSRLVTARVLQPLNTLPKCFIRIQVR